ncbi:MAG: FAD-dependent oxidoreductase [Thermoanaerobaculia bacterium]
MRRVARKLLTFVVVGGGPTGVELAGALAEVSRRTLAGEFRAIDPAGARILLVEALDRVLTPFPEKLSARAARDLERLGVELKLGWMIEEVHPGRVVIKRREGEERETVTTDTVLWGAGVGASPLGASLAQAAGVETDRGGRVPVGADCSLAGHPEVFVIGDLARFEEGLDSPLPGLAPVAMQQGRYVGRRLRALARGRTIEPFRYRDKGMMATIGRKLAVAKIGRFGFGGLAAWLTWLFVHLMYLTEFENRVLVLLQWAWNYITRNRSARLITGDERPPE